MSELTNHPLAVFNLRERMKEREEEIKKPRRDRVVLEEGEANGDEVPCRSLAGENGEREPKGELRERESEGER